MVGLAIESPVFALLFGMIIGGVLGYAFRMMVDEMKSRNCELEKGVQE